MENLNKVSWPDSAVLYQPNDLEQALLHENSSCLAVRTYLTMCNLPFRIEFRSNAEFMASNGRLSKLPLLLVGSDVFAEFQPITTHVSKTVLESEKNSELEDEMWAYMTWVENTFTMAEIYMSFKDKEVYTKVTEPRLKSGFPWPLDLLRARSKRIRCLRLLSCYQWRDMSSENVVEKLEKCCQALAEKLKETSSPFFGGEHPCELDALVFGHIFTILTTKLRNEVLSETLLKFPTLVELCRFIEMKFFKEDKAVELSRKMVKSFV